MIIRHIKSVLSQQEGAVLVLFATVFLPLLVIGSILAVDISSVYVQKTQLQTTADAAALTGAAKIRDFLNDKRSISTDYPTITSEYVKSNLNHNNAGVSYNNITVVDALHPNALPDSPMPDVEDKINASVYYNATKNTVQVTLRRRVPLYYFRMTLGKILPGGFSTIPIAAQATAEYGSSGATYKFTDSNQNNPFNYALVAASNDATSLNLLSAGMYFTGNIRTNGKISATSNINKQTPEPNKIDSGSKIYVDKYGNKDAIWNLTNADKDKNYPWLIEKSTSTTTPLEPDITSEYGTIDISNTSTNSNTQLIQNYITAVANMSSEEREKNHIYYDPVGSMTSTYVNTINDYTGLTNVYNKTYTTIIVNGDITANPTSTLSANAILISLTGNIAIHNSGTFTALAYAPHGEPNGNIVISGSGEVKGSFVGNTLTLSTTGQKVTYEAITTSTGGQAKIMLIPNSEFSDN